MVGVHWLCTNESAIRCNRLSTCCRLSHPRAMFTEQYDRSRTSTELHLSMCRKERELRLARSLQHQHGYWGVPFGFSTEIRHTEEEQNHSLEVCTNLRFSCCSQWLSVWFHRIENLEEFSWLRSVPINVIGRMEESDEHFVVNEIGHVVRVRTVRRCVENENSSGRNERPQWRVQRSSR